jgi:hypothetical protein
MNDSIELLGRVSPVNPSQTQKRIEQGVYGLEPFQVVVTASTDNVVKILGKQIIIVDFSRLMPDEEDDE